MPDHATPRRYYITKAGTRQPWPGQPDPMRLRVHRQRRELKRLNRRIRQMEQSVLLANHRAHDAYQRLSDERSRRYRTRAWRLWLWFRRCVWWRVGSPAWNKDYWYQMGQREAGYYLLGQPKDKA